MDSTVAIEGCGIVWPQNRGNNRGWKQLGAGMKKHREERTQRVALVGKKEAKTKKIKKSQDFNLSFPQ